MVNSGLCLVEIPSFLKHRLISYIRSNPPTTNRFKYSSEIELPRYCQFNIRYTLRVASDTFQVAPETFLKSQSSSRYTSQPASGAKSQRHN